MFARKRRCGTANRHDEVGRGGVRERGTDVVDDGLFRCDDKPCRTHHDLDHARWRPRAFREIDAEIGGESVERQVAAGERLQQEDVSHRRLGFGAARYEQQPTQQRCASESAVQRSACRCDLLPPEPFEWLRLYALTTS